MSVHPPPSPAKRWFGLALIATAQFVVIMDTSIIGVALPDMQRDLGFTPESLSWVFNAYVVAFGGLLLLGGRLADAFGARKVFVLGWLVLIAGSLMAGAATSIGLEIAGRAVQGAGSALIAPAALTLLMMLFGGTADLPKAFAVYGAAAPIGGHRRRLPRRSADRIRELALGFLCHHSDRGLRAGIHRNGASSNREEGVGIN